MKLLLAGHRSDSPSLSVQKVITPSGDGIIGRLLRIALRDEVLPGLCVRSFLIESKRVAGLGMAALQRVIAERLKRIIYLFQRTPDASLIEF